MIDRADWTPAQNAHVRGIIAFWRKSEQRMRDCLDKAVEAKGWGVMYCLECGNGGFRVISGYDLYLSDAIGWASRS